MHNGFGWLPEAVCAKGVNSLGSPWKDYLQLLHRRTKAYDAEHAEFAETLSHCSSGSIIPMAGNVRDQDDRSG
jgi:hypothetical protein